MNKCKSLNCIKKSLITNITNISHRPKKPQRNPKEIEILNAIENDTAITVSELAKTLGYTVDSVQHYINKLKEEGIITHTGSTKGGTWEILEDKLI